MTKKNDKTDKKTNPATTHSAATSGETDQALRDRLQIIRQKQADIDKATLVVADLKADLKTAKEAREGKIIDLGEFIRGEGPLFEEKESTTGGCSPSRGENTETAEE